MWCWANMTLCHAGLQSSNPKCIRPNSYDTKITYQYTIISYQTYERMYIYIERERDARENGTSTDSKIVPFAVDTLRL